MLLKDATTSSSDGAVAAQDASGAAAGSSSSSPGGGGVGGDGGGAAFAVDRHRPSVAHGYGQLLPPMPAEMRAASAAAAAGLWAAHPNSGSGSGSGSGVLMATGPIHPLSVDLYTAVQCFHPGHITTRCAFKVSVGV